MKLKVAAISDIHGHLPKMEVSADILLIAGDISPLGIQRNIPEMIKWLNTDFAEWINNLPVEVVFMVAGNHDFVFENIRKSNLQLFYEITNGKVIYLKNELYSYINNGFVWTIFGTPYCDIFGNWPFMLSESELEEKFEKIPDEVDIIISHDSPYGINNVGSIHLKDDVGNAILADVLLNTEYKLFVSGHIHSGNHIFDEETKTVNVSYVNEHYKPQHDFFYIELEK